MTIAEPTTTLTDYVMAAAGLALGGRLAARARGRAVARTLWGMALMATGVAALIGGTSHGFGPHLSGEARAVLWRAAYGTVGIANLFILAAAATVALRGVARSAAAFVLTARLALYLHLITQRSEFRYVVYDYALTLLALAVFGLHQRWRARRGVGWLMTGIAVSLAGALAQRGGLALHPHFNHNDLFHVLQTLGIYCYFRAGEGIGPEVDPPRSG